MESVGEEEATVAHRWTRHETLVMANALKAREEAAHDVVTKSTVGATSDKWETISKYCRSHGVPRTSGQCCNRWSKNIYHDYRRVRDWEKQAGVESYWKMKEKKRRENKLPICLDEEVYSVLVSFLDPDLKRTGTPESEVDSDRPTQHVSPAAGPDSIGVHQRGSAVAAPPPESGGTALLSDFARLQARVAASGDSLPSIKNQCEKGSQTDNRSAGETEELNPSVRKRKRLTTAVVGDDKAARASNTTKDPTKPAIDVVRPHNGASHPFGEKAPAGADRSSWSGWDGQHSLSALEVRLAAQNEALWARVRQLNEQVVQLVDTSNQRLQSQLQAFFSQICMQLQVVSVQMQAQVHEATRAVQSELHMVLQAHSDQVQSQLHSHHSLAPHLPGPTRDKDRQAQNGSWTGNRSVRASLANDLADPGKHTTPSHPPWQVNPRRERNAGQGQVDQFEGLPAHIAGPEPPHSITNIDRFLRQQQVVPAAEPNWNQARFVISELDRVLGFQQAAIPVIPVITPPAKCTYVVNETDRSMRQQRHPANGQSRRVSGTSGSTTEQADIVPQGSSPGADREVYFRATQGRSDIPIYGPVLALPRVVTRMATTQVSSDEDEHDNASPDSSDTVDADERHSFAQEVTAPLSKTNSSPKEVDELPRV